MSVEETALGAAEVPLVTHYYPEYLVVVADDEPAVAELVEKVVSSRLGCRIAVTHSGDEALSHLTAEAADVFVTDMRMPGINGLAIIRAAKRLSPSTSIVVMTGYGSEFPYVEAINSGADDFINKPFAAQELEAKLARIFRERHAQRERERAESKYRSLFELSADGMVLLDDQNLTIIDANVAFKVLSARDAAAFQETRIYDFFDDRDRMRLEHWLGICSRSGKGTMADLVLQRPNGEQVHVDITASFIQAPHQRLVFLTLKDVTEKREVDKRLAEAAQRDELTGLFNKRSFQNKIEGAVNRAQRSGSTLCLMFIDLDNFKRCNDTYGHQVGDKLLISVGDAIQKSIRATTSDEGFRCGGDEFAVVMQGTPLEGSQRVAERVQAEFSKNEAYGTSMSIGIAQYAVGMGADAFIRVADEALYKAKAAGKNCIALA